MKGIHLRDRRIKALALSPLAFLLMGNQSCQQMQTARAPLKKLIEVTPLSSPTIVVPGVTEFDLGLVANQQLEGALLRHEAFSLKALPRVAPASMAWDLGRSLSTPDVEMFRQARLSGGAAQPGYDWSTEASCMVNLPMARLGGAVNSFEILGGSGISLGFFPGGIHTGGGLSGDVNFQVESAQMALSMKAWRPLSGNTMAAVNVTAHQTKTSLGFGLNLGMFRLGPSFFYETPLATVTLTALSRAVRSLQDSLSIEPWFTRVLANHDTELTIIGGRNLGLQVGDLLSVYNERYYWQGLPCESQYYGGAAKEPVAIIQIESVGDEISLARIIEGTDERPVIGAKVSVKQLVQPASMALTRAK